MRIISKFHDYYDTALGHGADPDVVYLRDTQVKTQSSKEYESTPDNYMMGRWSKNIYRLTDPVSPSMRTYPYDVYSVYVIGFCGKLYSMKHTITRHGGRYDDENVFSYEKPEGWGKVSWKREGEWFEGKEDDTIFRKHKVPIFMSNDKIRVLNPCLKDVEFYKIFDAYSAFQEISMYLGGVLGGSENEMVTISDEDKRDKHGFDEWSFKDKPPGEKKERRKRNKKAKRKK